MLVFSDNKPKDASLCVRPFKDSDKQGVLQIDDRDQNMPSFVVVTTDDQTVVDFGSLKDCVQSCTDNAFNGDFNPSEYFYVEL